MSRRVASVLGLFLVVGAVLLIVFEKKPRAPEESTPAPSETASAAPSAAAAPAPPSAETPSAAASDATATRAPSRFDKLDDGSPVPPLADDAPRQVKLAVALFSYQGAQGAGPTARSRDAALELARQAIQAGSAEFSKALEKADRGSRDDVGWIARGILEKRVEHEIFRLAKGTLSPEPIDTPRGFWVVRRIQ